MMKSKFCNHKKELLNALSSTIRSTVVLSGRDGLLLIDELYKGVVAPPEISNIMVFVKKEEKQRIKDELA